jgi:methionyl aminopeptidase
MRAAGRLAHRLLDYIESIIEPGMTGLQLDKLADEFTIANGGTSACKGYRGYKHAVCISTNHILVHGVPTDKHFRRGDIVNVDVTVLVDGWHGDSSRTFILSPAPRADLEALSYHTRAAMFAGIAAVRPGVHVGAIGIAISKYVAKTPFSVAPMFAGHGIGRVFHDHPTVAHIAVAEDYGPVLEPGMTLTVEPVLVQGKGVLNARLLSDGWTVVPRGSAYRLSAQWEHTVLVTETGVEVLT